MDFILLVIFLTGNDNVDAGAKSPPGLECGELGGMGEGITLSPVNEYLQRKALITTVQQVRECRLWYCLFAHHQVPPEEGAYNHGSAGERVQVMVLSFCASSSTSRGRCL
jgi:hypothetical protein